MEQYVYICYVTSGRYKLLKAAHTNRILSIVAYSVSWFLFMRLIGKVACRILKVFILPIALSTCIPILESSLENSTSLCDN